MEKKPGLEIIDSREALAVDPVCGMTVDTGRAAGSTVYDGRTYYFCSRHCLEKFERDPRAFVGDGAAKARPAEPSGGAVYTCPMHPEVVRDAPGACPICGMALEPRTVTVEDGPNAELVDMARRFWVAAVLTLPVFLVAMSDMLPGRPLHVLDVRLLNWVQLLLATPVVLWCGWPFFVRGWASVVNRSPNMFTLIALGVGTAYLYSLVATVVPRVFPEGWSSSGRCLNCEREARRAKPFGDCSGWRRARRAWSARTDARRTCRWSISRSATWCGCGPAKKCPWTAL